MLLKSGPAPQPSCLLFCEEATTIIPLEEICEVSGHGERPAVAAVPNWASAGEATFGAVGDATG